jgi:titin
MDMLFSILDKPGPPNPPTVSDIYSTKCTVNWKPPVDDGGAPITGYVLERAMAGSSRWIKMTKELIKETSYEVTDLNEGSQYIFKVSAVNKAGVGKPSQPSKPFTAKDPWGK